MGCGLTVCQCIFPSTYYNGEKLKTSTETIPSPLADYFINILKAESPYPRYAGDFTPISELEYQRNGKILLALEEHVKNILKCPKGHELWITTDCGHAIEIQCTNKDCIFSKVELNL